MVLHMRIPPKRRFGGPGHPDPLKEFHETPINTRDLVISTSATFPEPVRSAFEYAEALKPLGVRGVEVLPVFPDKSSQDVYYLRRLRDKYETSIPAIHVPCLGLETFGVWGWTPWEKVDRSIEAARELGAQVIVLHPPYWWEPRYAASFLEGVAERQEQAREFGLKIAVENMYPRRILGCRPHWNPPEPEWATLDVSHAAASGYPVLGMAREMGERLAHIHLSDSVTGQDKHMVPGRGEQPLRALFHQLVETGYTGSLTLEVNTSFVPKSKRLKTLAEACAFVQRNWPSAQ